MKFIILPLFISILLLSCGTPKRALHASKAMQQAKENAALEMQNLDYVKSLTEEKLAVGQIDSTIKDDYENLTKLLVQNLQEVEKQIKVLERFLNKKSNFKGGFYEKNVEGYVAQLDSFNVLKRKREKIYALVTEAISMNAFNLFEMGAFFDPGVYRIPANAIPMVHKTFSPVLDSIRYLSNKHSDLPRTIRFVFVGYADESPIAIGTPLHKELVKYSRLPNPSNKDLNQVLSQLRANEMMGNMQSLVQEKSSQFDSLSSLKTNYLNYGRGEALPNANIKNYQKQDERRRIVMFYWSVLPDIGQ